MSILIRQYDLCSETHLYGGDQFDSKFLSIMIMLSAEMGAWEVLSQ